MTRRADAVDATRQRIVEAAAHLHGTVGPAATTVSGIATAAEVTRLTVYRHFPDGDALFAACSAHWAAGQTPPDPAAWARIADPAARLRVGLDDLYRFYSDGEQMLSRVLRDFDALPAARRHAWADGDRAMRTVLLEPFDVPVPTRRRLRALVAHATWFWTWQDLCVRNRLSRRDAVHAMTVLVLNASRSAEE